MKKCLGIVLLFVSAISVDMAFSANDQNNIHMDKPSGEWLNHGRTADEKRFSPLTQINLKSVGKLGLA